MIRHLLAGCSLLVVLSLGSLPVQAETPKPAPVTPVPSPVTISPDELKKFASAVKKVLIIARETDDQMVQVVQKEGLSEARFNEIYQVKKDPSKQPKTPITPLEQKTYDQILTKLAQVQKDAQTKMDQAVLAEGLQVERFSQIFNTVRKDPKLRQEVQRMMQGN
jgi:hypothetical protein